MTKRMLIDASHKEEMRVAIIDGTYLDELDIETSLKKQIKGNIYLAKIVRTEPSLQAAFVEYGGNRHGFLAFSEIHPDYYQIPVADKEKIKEAMLSAQTEKEKEREEREKAKAAKNASFQANVDNAINEEIIGAAEAAVSHEEMAENIGDLLDVNPDEVQKQEVCCAVNAPEEVPEVEGVPEEPTNPDTGAAA